MRNKLLIGGALALASLLAACTQQDATTANLNSNVAIVTNANSNTGTETTTTTTTTTTGAMTTAPDNSEVEVTDAGGVRTETRTFKGENRRVERVVVTTRDGKRTARVYSKSGEVKDLPDNKVERALDDTGDALGDAAGFVVDKSKDAASATKEGAEKVVDKTGDAASATKEKAGDVIDKTVDTSKTVGEKTVEGTKTVVEKGTDIGKTVGEKTADTSKTVGKKTAEGAKKVGGAIKKAVTP